MIVVDSSLLKTVKTYLACSGRIIAFDPSDRINERRLKALLEGLESETYATCSQDPNAYPYLLHEYAHTNHIAWGPSEALVVRGSFGLLFLDPLPNIDKEGLTADEKLLTANSRRLAPGGILVGLFSVLSEQMMQLLSRRFEKVRIFAPPEEFLSRDATGLERVVFGVKLRESVRNSTAFERIFAANALPEVIRPAEQPLYEVPLVEPPSLFRGTFLSPREGEELLRRSPLMRVLRRRCCVEAEKSIAGLRPPSDLHRGHVAMLLASGCMDGVVGTGPEAHVVRGTMNRKTFLLDEGDEGEERTFETFIPHVEVITGNGDYVVLKEVEP